MTMRPTLTIALGAAGAILFFAVLGFVLTERPQRAPAAQAIRVYRSEVVGWDGDRPALIRCPLCAGRGQARRWAHTGDGTDPRTYYPEGWVTCPACSGLGRQTVRGKPVEVIPDGMPLE